MANYVNRTFLTLFSALILPLALVNLCMAEVAVIRIQYRQASEMASVIEPLLSPNGKISVDIRTNALIIKDTSEALSRIRGIISKLDKAIEQLTISFRLHKAHLSEDRDTSASGKASGRGWSVVEGKRQENGVSVHAQESLANKHQASESFVSVASGASAYIRVGTNIPYTQTWGDLSRQYSHPSKSVSFRSIETGFEVRPVVVGDRVQIDIIPVISQRGQQDMIRFAGASTRLVVPRGKWATVGGTKGKSNSVMRYILSGGSTKKHSDLSMSLKVD